MKNRWLQLAASLVAMIMIANLQYCLDSVRQTDRAAEPLAAFGNPMGIHTLRRVRDLGHATRRLVDRPHRSAHLHFDRGVLCGFGWSGLGLVHTLGQLYGCYAIAGIGAAFVYSGSMGSALKWFPDRRGLAAGIISGGFGSGAALFIPLIQYIIVRRNYHQAFLYTGIVQGLIIIAVAQVLRHPHKEDLPPRKGAAPRQFTTPQMLRTPHFYVLYAMFVLAATGGLLVTAQAGPVAEEWKIPLTALTAALALDRVANGFSRIFWGWASDHLGRARTMAFAFSLQAACLVGILRLGARSGAWFTAMLIATFFTYGEVFSLFPSITGDYFGSQNAVSNYSFMYSAKGVASIIAGGLAALLFEKTGTWSGALWGSAAFALLSAIMALLLSRHPAPGTA